MKLITAETTSISNMSVTSLRDYPILREVASPAKAHQTLRSSVVRSVSANYETGVPSLGFLSR